MPLLNKRYILFFQLKSVHDYILRTYVRYFRYAW